MRLLGELDDFEVQHEVLPINGPADKKPDVHQCNGPRQFCGTVNVLRGSMNR